MRSPGISRGFSRGPFLHDRFRGRGRDGDRFRFRSRFDRFGRFGRNRCFGYGCWGYGYPWWGYDPWLWDWWNSDSSYDDDYNQNLATAAEMNRENLEEQRMLRQEQADGDQDAYSQRARRSYDSDRDSPSSAQKDNQKGAPILSDTVLVFRDKHQKEVENYAIVGDTLWNFAQQHTEKIPLADLDLEATKKANEDRGLTFRLPSAS